MGNSQSSFPRDSLEQFSESCAIDRTMASLAVTAVKEQLRILVEADR